MSCDLSDLLAADPPKAMDGIHESELADLLGLTANRIRTLTRDGVIRRIGPARYDRRQAVRDYCDHLRDLANRKGLTSAEADALKAEKLRVQRETADKLALANAASRRELVPVADVRREWVTAATDLRNALLAVPGRLQARLGLTAAQAEAADAEIRLALETLADE